MLFIDDRCRHKKSVSMDRAGKSPIGRLKIGMKCTVVMILGGFFVMPCLLSCSLPLGVRCCAVVSSSIMRAKKSQPGL